MVNEKTISFRLKPYIEEATLQIVLDILVVGVLLGVLIFAKMSLLVCISIVMGYFSIALFFHYRTLIQAIMDKYKRDYTTEVVIIKSFNYEYSFAGDRFGHSYIRFFYPKDMQVCKYKIKIIGDSGEKKKLRSVMSLNRLLEFTMLDKQQIEYLQVTYLKRSKILLHVDLVDEPVKITGKKKKVIEKAIDTINMSI